MTWTHPLLLLLFVPAGGLLVWCSRGSVHPMSPRRRRALLAVRLAGVLLVLLALAGPAWQLVGDQRAVIFILDHSLSQGEQGRRSARAAAARLLGTLPGRTQVGFVSAGEAVEVLRRPTRRARLPEADPSLMETAGRQTDLAAALDLAGGLFPPSASRQVVLLTDGQETRGDLVRSARRAALAGIRIDAVPVAGQVRKDARILRLDPSRLRLHEGASVALSAVIDSSVAGEGRVRLFENGVEVAGRPITLEAGRETAVRFSRTPKKRGLYTYRVRLEGIDDDTIPDNNEGLALVDVRGRPVLLYVEGRPDDARYLARAMDEEGIRLDVRPPEAIPDTLQDLAGYDGVILSDVPAMRLTDRHMTVLRDYVEHLGGGFLMAGGENAFGAGGYYRTPVEDILPVKMKAPDTEERGSRALMLVIDRSGSMQGVKVELAKSAAVASVELLSSRDYVGVAAFDSAATWIVPMRRASDPGRINARIATLNAGGGTNLHPAMVAGYQALAEVHAKVKHMLILTDGRTTGGGYEALAAEMNGRGMTVSTVAIGTSADIALLRRIADAGAGEAYVTNDPSNIPRIFTRDTMVHLGKLIHEDPFVPKRAEGHPMIDGLPLDEMPTLLGYVKARPKATARVPLVTPLGDPLLAQWRFGLGKVTAFTSGCKDRWAALWITSWPAGYGQFWAQVLRETAREPQGQLMDIRLLPDGRARQVRVDLMEDPGRFENDAAVEADVFFVPAGALGSRMRLFRHAVLQQKGPGRYAGTFTPRDPGVYLVRARAGARMVSAGMVQAVSGEAATGRVNRPLLERACRAAGGRVLDDADATLTAAGAGGRRFVELGPPLLVLALLLFAVDCLLRRWENAAGMAETLRDTFRAAETTESEKAE